MIFKLEDIASFQKGFAFKSKDFKDTGIRIVKVTNLNDASVDLESCVRVDDGIAKTCAKYDIYENDIIITTVGSWPTNPASIVGKVVRMPKTDKMCLLNQNAVRIRSTSKVNQHYLYYLLRNDMFKDYIIGTAQGSANQASITQKDIKNFVLKLPDLEEQKAVADILVTLDEKIEVNNQTNIILEKMAQEIFKSWFTDFEFPNDDGEPYKSSGGEMVESQLGLIPKGWVVKKIGEVCECKLGGTPSRKKPEYWNGEIPWINSGEVNKFRILMPTEKITKIGKEKSATNLLKAKTTVLAITGATLGQVSLLEIDTCVNQSVVGICENDLISYTYIYPFVINSIKKIIGNQTGGAQQHINKNNIESTKIIVPSRDVVCNYNRVVEDIYDLISKLCFENLSLNEIRNLILPKLMSGEIRVPMEES